MTTDNSELEHLMEILENMSDQAKATSLLRDLNNLSKKHSNLLFNRDPKLTHEEWKKQCDNSKEELDKLVNLIYSLKDDR